MRSFGLKQHSNKSIIGEVYPNSIGKIQIPGNETYTWFNRLYLSSTTIESKDQSLLSILHSTSCIQSPSITSSWAIAAVSNSDAC